jgi:hypothetical protein
MKLKFINAEDTERHAKATVHKSGKLGFSGDAIEFLNITNTSTIQFAQNEDDLNDLNLYAIIHESTQEGAFKISKAGKYYYVNTKNMFDNLNIDYQNKTIIYDLVKTEYDGNTIIKMIRREIKKKGKDVLT